MVTRKPVPGSLVPGSTSPPKSTAIIPPYPITPATANVPAPYPMDDARTQFTADATADKENTWNRDGVESRKEIPDLLRVGPPAGYNTPKISQERLRPEAASTSTNPYLRKQHSGSSMNGNESSAGAWGGSDGRPAHPSASSSTSTYICPPADSVPTQSLRNLSLSEQSTNPWQPALDSNAPRTRPPIPSLPQENSGNDAWAVPPPARVAPSVPPIDTTQHVLIDIDEPESPAWDEDEPSPVIHEMPADNTSAMAQMHDDRHAWDDQVKPIPQASPFVVPAVPSEGSAVPQQGEGWNLIDHEPMPVGAQESGTVRGDGQILDKDSIEEAPALPPRRSEDKPPPQPPRPVASQTSTGDSLSSPATRKQTGETYEIKKISWFDKDAKKNPRISPILVQNANGPCPLLALVNALVLSTPAHIDTALIDTLRSREQVSLGLLLDAVFDELMSGRRGDAAQGLPDVSDLYKFLVALHTGMNVNPRFFSAAPVPGSNDPRNPIEGETSLPGTFEETREMKLYSTFSVPLIHGWLPEVNSPAYAALKRSAQSYEECQNMMFHEEVLEEKLRAEGLSFEEQATLEDINTIKAFFASNATQLTPYGLNIITASIMPGGVAILFRNDHFSTLYRHPDTLQLLQLVTDMGYAGHEEVVWESLTDVSGEKAEFLSGDFRLVGGASNADPDTRAPDNGAQGHRAMPSSASRSSSRPQSPNTEQEDHDFALAMQLQEEEEERHRVEVARRMRESELSQQYIEHQDQARNQNQNQNNNIPIPQRRGSSTPHGGGGLRPRPPSRTNTDAPEARPAIPPRRMNAGDRPADPEAGDEAPPPTYEQAAGQEAYVPPANHPAHPGSSPMGVAGGGGRRMSAFSINNSVQSPGGGFGGNGRGSGRGGRRPPFIEQLPGRMGTLGSAYPGGAQQHGHQGKDRDCVVM
ncbi:DUF455 domain protein [Drepanopeziza brunnea f. sp. 'multigermtubi' MB_m1]|uniref:DUF455 domain protein n=1 Tax=Marssonina brunnea f. sp. multigermtubi (strain MB_m1) TaxID=1072389 RepID=K1WUU0_MARBU|nr:DUF455 domain protein [Drepanopeziza brunnea f. sp. 'multigermtubi' MB_m1]EKD16172.1 DUF455 domain protein [Drepanopeziza brunnea f. sp. 'multigermtubi' MB_m1]